MNISKTIAAIFILFFKVASAQEAPSEVYELTKNVREILIEAPTSFELSKEEADGIKALVKLDEAFTTDLKLNGETCEKKPESKTKLEVVVVSSDKKFEQQALGRMDEDYFDINYLIDKYREKNPAVSLDQYDLKKREELLQSFAVKDLGLQVPSGIVMKELALREMISNSEDWKAVLSDARDTLTSKQKIALVSRLGGLFSDHYNYERASTKSMGEFVSSQQLLDSVKNGTTGGVCRDIALAQTQYLEELGFKQSYVVAYKNKGVQHATVIAVDPETNKIVKFNYSDTTLMKAGSGTEALVQNHSLPDYGLSYRVFDTKGKPVTKVSSELSQMLKSATNGERDRVFNQKNYSIAKVGFQNDLISGNLFTGKTSTGDRIYGIAINKEIAAGENLKYNYGAAISQRKGERTQAIIDQKSLYILANVDLSTSSIKTGPSETKAFASVSTEVLLSNNKETKKSSGVVSESKNQLDAGGDITVGLQNRYISPSGKTTVNSEVSTTIYPELNHVASADGIRPAINQSLVRSSVSTELSDSKKALIEAAVVIRKYGTSAVVKAALLDEKRRITYSASASTPLNKDVPTFLPGGEKRISAGASKKVGSMLFVIEVDKNLTNKSKSVSVKGQGSF